MDKDDDNEGINTVRYKIYILDKIKNTARATGLVRRRRRGNLRETK